MASLPAQLISEMWGRWIEPLLDPGPVKMRLDTGSRRLTSAVVITDPADKTLWIPVTEGQQSEYRYNGLTAITIRFLDLYLEDGSKFVRMAVNKVLYQGDAFTFLVPSLPGRTVSTT